MTNGEAANWIINISADIGKAEHRDLWHYEQALSEIREMFESVQSEIIRCKDCKHWEIHKRLDIPWCRCLHSDMGADDYCSYAELRGDSDD